MSELASKNIILLGLPGSGKTRVAQSLHGQFGCELLIDDSCRLEKANFEFTRPGSFEWSDFLNLPEKQVNQEIWCVVDVRSSLPEIGAEWLKQALIDMLSVADGVVFAFVEAASLDNQAWWSKWIVNHSTVAVKKPIVRWMNQTFPADFKGFELATGQDESFNPSSADKLKQTDLQKVETFSFSVERIVLDHLLMGLDNSRQNLTMKICRVKGVVQTVEYSNLVAIEGSAYRWDTFAAESDVRLGELQILGIGLDQAWLTQIVKAATV